LELNMADAKSQSIVAEVTRRRAQAGEAFTAFDITTQARAEGAFIRHDEARDLVQSLFQDGSMGAAYRRTILDLGGGARPFLYHRFDTDPATYRSTASGAAPVSAPSAGVNSASPNPAAGQPSAGGGLLRRVFDFLSGGTSVTSSVTTSAATNSGITTTGNAPTSGPTRKTINLNASAFLPIGRDDLMRQSGSLNLFGNIWFGRRDLIPPVSDPRTMLIDRGMLSAGLLSADQLAEFHRIGDAYAKHAGEVNYIRNQGSLAGAAAIEADRNARAEAKERKKAESAERKQKRRDEIAHRRANDILFLGRGVSQGLADRTSDQAKLVELQLPVVSTPAELAAAMGMTISNLRWLAFHADVASRTHYVSFEIAKRSGGVRKLSAPHVRLAAVQRWIFDSILRAALVHEAAHGFVPGRSIITNAQVHVGQNILVNADLENFFPSIHWTRIRKVFHCLGYSPAVATILALLCTECPRRDVSYGGRIYHVATGPRGLPQGACTSPALSNLVAMRLDRRMTGLAAKFGINYTRYADDITISGGDELSRRLGYVMARLRHITGDEGFTINEKKTRVRRRQQAQVVTGLVVNDKVSVSRNELRRLRSILHHAAKDGLESQNRLHHPNFRGYMTGMIAYVSATRPELAREMKTRLDQVSA
jgi:RNA-directed DNA polymerase